jgi:hypothetical protein
MKKLFAFIAAVIFELIVIPVTSFALEPMKKEALKNTTGKAGVKIYFDHIVMVIRSQPTVTYWDTDGTSSSNGTIGQISSAGIRIESPSRRTVVIRNSNSGNLK